MRKTERDRDKHGVREGERYIHRDTDTQRERENIIIVENFYHAHHSDEPNT